MDHQIYILAKIYFWVDTTLFAMSLIVLWLTPKKVKTVDFKVGLSVILQFVLYIYSFLLTFHFITL